MALRKVLAIGANGFEEEIPLGDGVVLGVGSDGIVIYNTADQATNYERATVKWTTNSLVIGVDKGGTGTNRSIILSTPGSQLIVGSNGSLSFNGTVFSVGSAGYNAVNSSNTLVQTSDATVTTLQTIAIGTGKMYKIDAVVIAKNTVSSTNISVASYKLSALYKNVNGTVSIVGAINTETNEDIAAWDCAFVISGTNVLLRVTGAASTTILWQLAEIKVYSI